MIENKNKYKDLPKLNGNVIDITPLIRDEWWRIKEKLEKETNGKEETRKEKQIKLASVDEDILSMEYWFERWQEHPLKNKFRTLKDFISYSLSVEDQPTFHGGGIVSEFKNRTGRKILDELSPQQHYNLLLTMGAMRKANQR